jgi:hypothetical protein
VGHVCEHRLGAGLGTEKAVRRALERLVAAVSSCFVAEISGISQVNIRYSGLKASLLCSPQKT